MRGVFGVLLLAAALAGCAGQGGGPEVATAGGATPSSSGSGPGSAGADDGDRALRFARCMREHGVDMPDPVGGRIEIHGRPGQEGTIEAAQEACAEFAPGGGEGGGPELSAADQERFLRFARCMREHGVPMADPEFEGGGVRLRVEGGPGSEPDRETERAAQQACHDLLPDFGPGGPAGPGAGAGGGDT